MKSNAQGHHDQQCSFVCGLVEPAVLCDEIGVVCHINQTAIELLCLPSPAVAMGAGITDLLQRGSKSRQQSVGSREQIAIKTDQGVIAVESSLSEIQFNGQIYHLYILHDLSQVNHLKKQLGKAESRLGEMMGNLPVTMFQMELSPQSKISFPFISAQASSIMGVERDALMQDPLSFLAKIPTKTKRHLLRQIKQSALNGKSLDEVVSLQLDDGVKVWLRFFANLRKVEEGTVIWDGAAIDVTGQHLLDERLRYLAYHDESTHLPNRLALEEYLDGLFDQSFEEPFAILSLAIDRLDLVNDTLGNETADRLVLTVAEELSKKVEEGTFIAHPRPENFSIVLRHFEDEREIVDIADDILKAMKIPFEVGTRRLDISVSMGISLSYRDGEDAATLMMNAETALRRAHLTSPGGYRFYVEEMNTRALRVLAYENRLRKALAQKEFVPFFQPLIDAQTGRVAGMEALVRWKHPRLGLIGPGEFIQVAEEAGLIGDICHQMLESTCRTAKGWLDSGYEPIPLAVNISWRQFAQPERLMLLMNKILADTGLPAELLELELTESSVMEEPDSAIKTLNDLRDCGVMASIDDFGTGYSSLSYLKRLPISKLKIDRAFIHEVTENERDGAIVDAIIMLARALGLKTVAEGIETKEQLDMIRQKGCDLAQGFYFSRPVPADEMEKIIRQGTFSVEER